MILKKFITHLQQVHKQNLKNNKQTKKNNLRIKNNKQKMMKILVKLLVIAHVHAKKKQWWQDVILCFHLQLQVAKKPHDENNKSQIKLLTITFVAYVFILNYDDKLQTCHHHLVLGFFFPNNNKWQPWQVMFIVIVK